MNKLFKKILSIIILGILVLPFFQVYAQTPMVIENKGYIVTGSRTEAKFKTNKGYAYCITPDRVGAQQGATLSYMSSEDKGGVLYLLEKAGTSDHDYLVSQLAIWIYKFNYMPDYYVNNSSLEVVQSAKRLADEANRNNNYATGLAPFKISANNTSMQLTSDGKNYRSVITINSVTSKDEIKAELQDAFDGVKLNKLESNGTKISYEVLVPVEKVTVKKTFKVKVTDTYTVNTVERYTPGDGHQDLVVLVPTKKSLVKDITLSVEPIVRKCEIYNNQYYGTDGNVVSKEVYESQCLHKCQHVGDKYYDKDGNETTETNYQIQCFKHTCEKIGDKYFGRDGFEVSYSDYKSQCEPAEVIVPDTKTSSFSGILFILVGSSILGTVLGYIEYRNKRIIKLK